MRITAAGTVQDFHLIPFFAEALRFEARLPIAGAKVVIKNE